MNVPPARPVFPAEDRAAILAMIDESLRTGSLTLGPRTRDLEDCFLREHGGDHAVAVASGTAALEIVLRTIGVEGRDVVVPTNTFFATAAAAAHAGGRPRFADVDPITLALSPSSVEAAITPETAAVIVVHIGGLVSPDLPALRDLCDRRGVALVEDAAHAHGSTLGGRPAGTFGVAGTFSFYPTKVVTSAEGGMIVTGREDLRDEARIYRDQGKAAFVGGDHTRLGYAWRLSEVQAAIGLTQVRRLAAFTSVRQKTASIYDSALDRIDGIERQPIPEQCVTNHYKYIAFLASGIDRDVFKARMRERGVGMSGEVYASPLHRQPVFAGLHDGRPLPIADDACARHVCLPIHSDMTEEEASFVVEATAAVMAGLA